MTPMPATTPTPTPTVSVVICTYNRPQLLEQTLVSCLREGSPAGLPYEIVVADNSPAGYGADVAARAAAQVPGAALAVRAVPASPPNISIARNAGIAAGTAPLVAFLDDDLTVEPGWLDALVRTQAAHDADMVMGPLRPRFETGTPPAWDPQATAFTRVLDAPTGTPIKAWGAEKTPGFTVHTASSLWKRATCFTEAQPFDPAFGACGGEDFDLVVRLERQGRSCVWCAEAGVWELVPAERVAFKYRLLRAYSGGQVYAAAAVKNADAPAAMARQAMLRGAVQAVAWGLFALPAALLAPFDGGKALRRALVNAALGAGKLAWRRTIPLYHIEKPAP